MLLDKVDSRNCRTAGCEHRICDNDRSLLDRIREFAEIFVRLMSLLVAVETDMTESSRTERGKGHRLPFRDLRAGSERWLISCLQASGHTCLDWSLDLNVLQREIAECLISHQSCDLLNKSTELICSCGLLS